MRKCVTSSLTALELTFILGGAYMQGGGQAAPSFAELAVNASCLAVQD